MDIAELSQRAAAFKEQMATKKVELAPSDFWYPYDTMGNFAALDRVLTGENRNVFGELDNSPIADIGAADGDLAFFLESLGHKAQIIDYAPTNYNQLRGAALLRDGLHSSVQIVDVDLDAQFALPEERYSVVFFLGILYHLKNPYYILETLAKRSQYCFLNTRVARVTPDKATNLTSLPVAYLLYAGEANNDDTNYWIFSDAGLRRILERTGWDILDYGTFGNTVDSDPVTWEGDERACCLLRSRYVK